MVVTGTYDLRYAGVRHVVCLERRSDFANRRCAHGDIHCDFAVRPESAVATHGLSAISGWNRDAERADCRCGPGRSCVAESPGVATASRIPVQGVCRVDGA